MEHSVAIDRRLEQSSVHMVDGAAVGLLTE
jgi:hypothetical protein